MKYGHSCSVFGCLNNQRDYGLSFFMLPTDRERRNEWLKRIGRPDLLNTTDLKPSSYRVCSVHFEDSMMTAVRKLEPGAVPTKFLNEPRPSTSKYKKKSENIKDSAECDVSTQTKDSIGSYVNLLSVNRIKNASVTTTATQTENAEQIAQASVALSSNKLRKRKLHDQLRESKKWRLARDLNIFNQEKAKNSLSLVPSDDDEVNEYYYNSCTLM